jgi:hypothetical protein
MREGNSRVTASLAGASVPSEGCNNVLGKNQDPWARRRVGLLVFVLTPAVFLGGGLLSASNALNRVIGPREVKACSPVTVKAPLPNSFTVNVLNAEGPQGAARAVAKELPLRDFKPGVVGNVTVETRVVQGVGELRFGPDGADQALLVQKLLLSDVRMVRDYRPDTSVDLVLGPKFTALKAPDGPLVRRADVVVNVYNTTYYEGLGKTTSDGLVALGYKRGAVGLDPQNAWVQDTAVIRHGADGLAGAKLVKEAVPAARLVLDPSNGTTAVDLLIGMTWQPLATADKLTKEPPKKAPGQIEIERPCPKA